MSVYTRSVLAEDVSHPTMGASSVDYNESNLLLAALSGVHMVSEKPPDISIY